jgi:hypothetical protein
MTKHLRGTHRMSKDDAWDSVEATAEFAMVVVPRKTRKRGLHIATIDHENVTEGQRQMKKGKK